MRRALALLAVAAALYLFSLAPTASAAVPIPGTNVQVVELGPTSQVVPFGTTANFTWAVFNGGPATYSMNVTANVTEPDFAIEVVPTDFTIPRDELREVRVNVSAPANGETVTATIQVTFTTLTPTASSLQVNATLTVQATPPSLDVLTAFVAIGAIIAIGFTATWIFERTHIPDLFILILLGVVLGPFALLYFGISLVPQQVLQAATPYFTALALMIILFDGGLNLPVLQVVKRLGIVGLHTGLAFVLTILAVAWVTVVVLGYDWLVGLLLGAALGGTSGAVVIGIVRALKLSEETKIILTLESVLTDVLCVVTALALIELLRGKPGASPPLVFADLGRAFLVAMLFGLTLGVGWLVFLRRVEKKPFAYMLTIAVLFILYGFTEASGGSGAMASFVFGLVLGNHVEFARRLRMQARFIVDDRIKQFHSELSFVVRTFFFVFLGLVFTFQFGGGWIVATRLPVLASYNGTFTLFMFGVLFIFLVIVGVRMLAARVTSALRSKPPAERRVLWSLMGRGLAAAVLASLPFTIPAFTSPTTPGDQYYQALMAPYEVQFLNIAFFVILLTVGATTLGVASSAYARVKPTVPPLVTGRGIGFLTQWDLEELQVHEQPPDDQL